MKYEIKGAYKFILGIILTILVASTGIQLYARSLLNKFSNMNDGNMGVSATPTLLVIILMMVIFGAFITAFFYIIGAFKKELYEDRGYLTFSLPLTGNQILGSKLIVALMWSALLFLSALIYNLIVGSLLFGTEWMEGLKYLFSLDIGHIILTVVIYSIFSVIITFLLIYLSMTLSRVTIRNKKIGGLWFILFLILNALVSYGTFKAVEIIPYYLDLSSFKIIGESVISNTIGNSNMYIMSPGTDMGMIMSSAGEMVVNIGSLLFSILVAIGTFLGTSYLIEKKIDI